MRSKGGYILIEIDKPLASITSDDFDKSIFRELLDKNIKKPLILTTQTGVYVLSATFGSGNLDYFYSLPVYEGGNLDGLTSIDINYVKLGDGLIVKIEEY